MNGSKNSSSALPFALLFVGLLVGAGGGYFLVSTSYQPKILDYEKQITDLNSIISTKDSEISNYQTQALTLQTTISNQENQISNYGTQVSSLEAQVLGYRSQVNNLQSQLSTSSTQISDLQTKLDNILDITVTQHYEWVYGSWLWSDRYQWDLPIPLSLYVDYYERSRPAEWHDWINMVKDPVDDYYISQMVQQINSAAIKGGFTEKEKVNFVIAFVQNLPYTVDSVTTPWNEYPRYPIETLFDRGGDCEDTSILVATLLDRMGYDVCLLILSHEGHCAVGVVMEGVNGSYYSYNDKKYFYLETTGEGYKIGVLPSSITDTRAYIYPINP